MLFRAINRRASYSLVELLVVIAVIVLIGVASIPNIFNRSDRLSLDSSANQLRQVIVEAQTRSKAPDKADGASSTQVYQVAFGNFAQGTNNGPTIKGTSTTNSVALERGLAQCATGDLQGGFTTLRNITLPRGIYIASFNPTVQDPNDSKTVIRFTVGQEGFTCGSYSNPLIKSASIYAGSWVGIKKDTVEHRVSRYLVIVLASQKVAEQRFVTVDRETGEVAVSRSSPQSFFLPVQDTLAPRWSDDVDANKFNLAVACRSSDSTVLMSFPRAKDRVNDPEFAGDPNLLVTYDISWNTGSGAQTLITGYFEDLSHETIRYQFTTDRFSVANQPHQVTVTVSAVDAYGLFQLDPDPLYPLDKTLAQRVKVFNFLSCGSTVSDPGNHYYDPGGAKTACNPITLNNRVNQTFRSRLARLLAGRAMAKELKTPCPPEVPS
ncbi:MAG: type II secretion system protein [Patescibacteria group bacterium]